MHVGLVILGVLCVVVIGFLLFYLGEGMSFGGLSVQVTVGLLFAAVVVLIILVFLLYKVYRASLLRVRTGREALIGAKGVAVGDLKPKGQVRVLSEFWQAVAKEGEIADGEEVEVVGMDGLLLVVVSRKEKA